MLFYVKKYKTLLIKVKLNRNKRKMLENVKALLDFSDCSFLSVRFFCAT